MSNSLLETTPDLESAAEHTLTGKIARLPEDLRDQVNQRLSDNKTASEILPWLNDLPVVKQILAAQFDGAPITKQNLSNWRQTGFQRWRQRQDKVGFLKDLAQYGGDLTQAAAGRLAPAAAAVASGKLLEFLEFLDTADPAKTDPNHLVKCAAAASGLLKMEQNHDRLKIAHQRLRQHDMALRLKRDKQQRDTIAIARHVLGDARAHAIENSSWSGAEKIEALGLHTFGPLWEPRPVPVETPVKSDAQPLMKNPHE